MARMVCMFSRLARGVKVDVGCGSGRKPTPPLRESAADRRMKRQGFIKAGTLTEAGNPRALVPVTQLSIRTSENSRGLRP